MCPSASLKIPIEQIHSDSNPLKEKTSGVFFESKTSFLYSQAGLSKPIHLVGRNAGKPCSVCLFAVEAPAANSNRCFLVFFSRESPGRYLQRNAKHQHGTRGPARSHIPPGATQPPPRMLSWGVGWAGVYALKTFSKITTSLSLFFFFWQGKARLSAAVEHCRFAQYNIN